ncbi:MAG: hypothetical protein JSS36_11965 [Proteobacteria bacterium]|nr:hypothetical protein [Pseudomonadota bacterium]
MFKFLARLITPTDDHAGVRGLWHAVVARARDPEWYARLGLADTVAGRFDAITLVLALVLLRMETSEPLIAPSVRLTELFVTDMDGQLRESGVGDLVVGKHIGKLMSVLGGRLGALREALADAADPALLEAAIERNMTLIEGASPAALAGAARMLAGQLAQRDDAAILAGQLA